MSFDNRNKHKALDEIQPPYDDESRRPKSITKTARRDDVLYVAGQGNPEAEIMFVANALTEEEAQETMNSGFGVTVRQAPKYLRGPCGMIRDIAKRAGINIEKDCYYTALVKWLLPREARSKPSAKMVKWGLPMLEDEIQRVKPKIIVAMGKQVFDMLCPRKMKFDEAHGGWFWSKEHNAHIYLMHPPVSLIMRPELAEVFRIDFREIKTRADQLAAGEMPGDDVKGQVISSMWELEMWLDEMETRKCWLYSVDCEWHGRTHIMGQLRSIQFAYTDEEAVYIRFRNEKNEYCFEGGDYQAVGKALSRVMALPSTRYLGHHYSADAPWMHHILGLPVIGRCIMDTEFTLFSPVSKDKDIILPNEPHEIDLVIGTDCISEGQNLQDCDYLINYDIHWNPVRIIQRFGRVDRIGSTNQSIQLVNYWPDISLDEYINLKERVENRMVIADATATGSDNPLNPKANDISYRKEQLRRLQEEVIEMEDLKTGISITDLGLNDFRMDLVSYVKENGDPSRTPNGMHAIVPADPERGLYPGALFALRNRVDGVNIDQLNRLHPYYLIYIGEDGQVVIRHTEVKRLLDLARTACKGRDEPIRELCQKFNEDSRDGRDMKRFSNLLDQAIRSVIDVKEESDIDSLFTPGRTTALVDSISGLDDFELISFLVIQNPI